MSPTRPARACRFTTCSNPAVSRGRCAVHAQPDEQQRHRYGSAIYSDRRWRGTHGLRAQVLQAHPVCQICGRLATTVDHIIPHRGDVRLAFDVNNLRSMCTSCHSRITAGQVRDRR